MHIKHINEYYTSPKIVYNIYLLKHLKSDKFEYLLLSKINFLSLKLYHSSLNTNKHNAINFL